MKPRNCELYTKTTDKLNSSMNLSELIYQPKIIIVIEHCTGNGRIALLFLAEH
jgi:hypothetical protein